ncbi:MAG TPA: hypothetical protein VKI99_05935 [Candidatus Dormibacteraeota bacterium]|nr:hypothetical protein [Candidatus Dormibacteraeota bacterium]
MLAWPARGGASTPASSSQRTPRQPLAIALAVVIRASSSAALAGDRVVDDTVGGTLPAIPDSGAAELLPDGALCE